MEIISGVKKKERYPLEIKAYPYLQDHYFEGQAILPAVEALIIMATVASLNFPQINVCLQKQARFPRFLSIDPQEQIKKVFADIEPAADGALSVTISDWKHLGGKRFNVPAAAIYRELVPFWKAYQNIVGELSLSPEGAIAHLYGGGGEGIG